MYITLARLLHIKTESVRLRYIYCFLHVEDSFFIGVDTLNEHQEINGTPYYKEP